MAQDLAESWFRAHHEGGGCVINPLWYSLAFDHGRQYRVEDRPKDWVNTIWRQRREAGRPFWHMAWEYMMKSYVISRPLTDDVIFVTEKYIFQLLTMGNLYIISWSLSELQFCSGLVAHCNIIALTIFLPAALNCSVSQSLSPCRKHSNDVRSLKSCTCEPLAI